MVKQICFFRPVTRHLDAETMAPEPKVTASAHGTYLLRGLLGGGGGGLELGQDRGV